MSDGPAALRRPPARSATCSLRVHLDETTAVRPLDAHAAGTAPAETSPSGL